MSDNIQKKARAEKLQLCKDLYRKEMERAVATMHNRLRDMIVNSYYKALWNPDSPNIDKLTLFFTPISKKISNSIPSTLNREKFIEVCHEQTIAAAKFIGWRKFNLSPDELIELENGTFIDKVYGDEQYKKHKMSNPDEKINYNKFPNDLFVKLVQGEFTYVKDDPDCVKRYFGCMDLQAYFKASQGNLTNNVAKHIFESLQEKGSLKGVKLDNYWNALCKNARLARNKYIGHEDDASYEELRKGGGPEEEEKLKSWMEIADLLHSEELNEEEYKEVEEAWDEAVKIHESDVFLFSELLQDIQDSELSDRNESDLRNAASSLGIPHNLKGVLYNGKREELIKQLMGWMREDIWIPLADLKELLHTEHLADGVEDLGAYFEDYDFTVQDGRVRGHSSKEVIALLKMRVDEKRSYSYLPKLNKLAKHNYKGGPMTSDQLRELVRTHQLILDASVVCSRVGRDFIEQKLLALIEDERIANPRGQGKLCLCMDKTTYNNIQQNHRTYKIDRKSEKNEEQLKPYDSAYIFIDEILFKKEVLELRGTKYRSRQRREVLLKYLEANSDRRFCVLTCGAVSELVVEGDNVISHNELPLCAVARIQGDYYYPDAKMQPGPNCQIFSQYLPLEIGGTPVDFDDPYRDQMRLPEDYDEYSTEAFVVSTEDSGQAWDEEMPEPESEQSLKLTIHGTEIYRG